MRRNNVKRRKSRVNVSVKKFQPEKSEGTNKREGIIVLLKLYKL